MIEESARAVGLTLEKKLAEVVVRKTMKATPQGAPSTLLPLLEFALTGLWERQEEGLLIHAACRAISEVADGLTQWADGVLSHLDEEQRQLTRRVLTALVHLGGRESQHP